MQSSKKNTIVGNIAFTDQEDLSRRDNLRAALDNQNAPVLGLVLKVKENADGGGGACGLGVRRYQCPQVPGPACSAKCKK